MQFIELPEELLIMIIQELDYASLQSLYDTCRFTRNVVCMHRVIKKCDLSCSNFATAHSMKLPFFKEISECLLELYLPGVPDLNKTILTQSMKKFKHLKILDVSYTNINILDFINISTVCPTIKDITIDFNFGNITKILQPTLLRCQSVFEQLENVTFIGSISNLLHSKLGLYLLSKSRLRNLTYTLSEGSYSRIMPKPEVPIMDVKMPNFCQFIIYFLDWRHEKTELYELSKAFLAMLESETYVYIAILKDRFETKMYASSIFKHFLEQKFNITIKCTPLNTIEHIDNMAFMWWDKNNVKFDDNFYLKLTKHLEQYFPNYFEIHSDMQVSPVSTNSKWFYTYVIPNANDIHRYILCGTSKRRLGAPKFMLDYDAVFENKNVAELSLVFKHSLLSTITLPSECSYLRKLKYLSLHGLTQYHSDFFKILFKCCESLETINIESCVVSPCAPAISRSLHLSNSLKNIRLVEKNIDFKKIFVSFSLYDALENIHIVDSSAYETSDLADPSILINKCYRLYSIYLEVMMTNVAYNKVRRQFKKAKEVFNRPYLYATIAVPPARRYPFNYDPFMKVFKLNPLKPV